MIKLCYVGFCPTRVNFATCVIKEVNIIQSFGNPILDEIVA